MLLDLSQQATCQPLNEQADVLVIGGGTCGLLVAQRLAKRGLRTVVLESGGPMAGDLNQELNQVVQAGGLPYRGATAGRSRGLGGTSSLWGGALLPFLPEDMQARPYLGVEEGWPLTWQALSGYVQQLEDLFDLDHKGFDASCLSAATRRGFSGYDDEALTARFAKWPSFKKRNTAHLFAASVARDPMLRVWVNATATSFAFTTDDQAGARLATVDARGPGEGQHLQVAARQVVLCAGAIESTRLLLLMREQSEGRVLGSCHALGRGFHDHVSIPLARLHAKQPRKLNELAGLRFAGSALRSFRLEMSPQEQRRQGSASAWAHIAFEPEGPSGFDALRDTMRAVQRRQPPRLGDLAALLRDLPYFLKLAHWRVLHHQLAWPDAARYSLVGVAEQLPCSANQITLADTLDRHGNRLAAINWHVSAGDVAPLNALREALEAYWLRHRLAEIAELEWLAPGRPLTAADLTQGVDVYHPGGTTRMGCDGHSAVVNSQLQCFDIKNLFVLSTSTFPTGAGANPTMMLLLLGLRLSDHLSSQHDNPTNANAASQASTATSKEST